MADLIRDIDDNERMPAGAGRSSVFLWIAAIIAIGAGVAAALNAQTLGWMAFLLLIGIAAIALMTIFVLVISRPVGSALGDETGSSRTMISAAFDQLPEPTLITQDGKPVYANQAYSDLARKLGVQTLSDSPPSVDRLFGTKVKSASAVIFRLHHIRHAGERAEDFVETFGPDGVLRRFHVRVSGTDHGLVWQIKDMSDEGRGGIDVLVNAPVGLFSVTPEGDVLAMNGVMRRWIGLGDKDAVEKMSEFIETPESLLASPQTLGRIVRNDARLITQKGIVTPAVMTGTWQELDNGQVYASVALYGHSGSAAMARVAADMNADESAIAKPAAPVTGDTDSAAPFGIARLDRLDLKKAVIVEVNAALVGLSGGHAQIGDKFSTLFADGEESKALLARGAHQSGAPFEVRFAGDKGAPVNVYISDDGAGEGAVAYIVDVSMRKDLENQLFQSQKMQAIGQFAGGVAHDFNNLLTAIRLNTDELLGRHPVGDPSYPELQKINMTVTRSAALVKQLLQFSRKQTQRTQVLGVTDTLSDLTVLLKQVLSDRVKLDVIHGRDLPSIRADKSQIETAMINLCVNARDAMAEQGGGQITISSHVVSGDALIAKAIDVDKTARFIRIDVTDTGTGMDEATLAKIFEPFFTTKDVGKGTGLGLATVYGIMQQSSGHLTVESALGKGTTFNLYLPAFDGIPDALAPDAIKARAVAAKPSDLAGTGTILFVEDEENVRDIAAKTLRKRGYTVIEAEDGEEAYEILESGEHKFDLMVSDVMMPGMDGPTLLRKGRPLLGDARIVFISGYAQEEFSDILSEEPDITFLPKPFTLLQLAQRVKAELSLSDD
ncbi:MAG: ATP-binding protein [Robiginitomaculum sp.]